MESEKDNGSALSPSMITDFFRKKKSSGHKRGLKEEKKDGPPPSVYLTPDSSPGSQADVHSPVKECESHDDVPDGKPFEDSLNLNTVSLPGSDGSQDVPTSLNASASTMLRSSVEEHAEVNSKDVSPTTCDSNAGLAESISNNLRTSKKHVPSQKTLAKLAHPDMLQERGSPKKGRNPVFSVQPLEEKSASPSPCLPRLKLRKSAKLKSGMDATETRDDESLKPKPGRRKKKNPQETQKSVITDFFPVRRSGRQTKSLIEKEKQHQIEQMILSGCEHGLEVKDFENKGRGVVATKDFQRGDFVVEYAGDLIDLEEARAREEDYGKDPSVGCYMYYFKCGSKQYCVDATAESGRLGRLLNHSSKDGNCCTRSLEVQGKARLILVAKRDINTGEELLYDYGDRSKESLVSHPWLKL